MLESGKKIGDYVLVEKIAHGAFGDVWKAEKQTPLSVMTFALKFFSPKEGENFKESDVQNEVEVWQSVTGLPNIISVIEADFAEGYIYIVSEYADGGSLQRWLAANGGKAHTVEQAVEIALEILNGLDYLHRAGFIHRDIKPANILIRKGTFCLADFGVSREIKTHSMTMHTAGTYQYMPPEAFSKKPSVSPETDIWAVGVILQELLTGKLPFPHDEIPSLMYSVLHEEPEEMAGDMPESLRRVVRQALQKQREDRFYTAREMIESLRQVQRELSGEIRHENIEQPAVKPETALPRDTIIDENLTVIENIEKPQPSPNPNDEKPFSVGAGVNESRRKNRNRLYAAGAISAVIILFGLIYTIADLFSTSATEHFEQGVNCLAEENYDCAIENYTKAIELNPNSAEPFKYRAAAYYSKGDFDLAVQDYNKAVELNPNDPNTIYGRGVAYFNRGDYDRAIENYNKAIALSPQDAKIFYNRGLAFYSKGVFDRAIEDYNRALEINPEYAEAFHNRGNVFDEQRKHERAIEDYDKAIELNPNYALAYSNRGAAYGRIGNFDRAVEDFSRAIEINPNLATSYFNRGSIYYLKNKFDEAFADFTKTIELSPTSALAFASRGVIYSRRGNYEQAIRDFSKAIEINPQDAQSYYNRAVAFEKIGNMEKSQEDRRIYQELKGKS